MSDNRSISTGKGVGIPLSKLLSGEVPDRERLLTGVSELDRQTGGLPERGLVVMAGRPMMGHSQFALAVARNMAMLFRTPVGYVTSECSEAELAQKMMTGIRQVAPWRMELNGTMVPLENVVYEMQPPLFFKSFRGIGTSLENYCKMLVEKRGVKVIFFDTVDAMLNYGRDFYGPGKRLSDLAMKLGVCIVAVAQLGRAVELRGGCKRPMLSDLRLGLEMHAEMTMLMYRAECYGIEMSEQGRTAGIMDVEVLGKEARIDLRVACETLESEHQLFLKRLPVCYPEGAGPWGSNDLCYEALERNPYRACLEGLVL